MCFCIYILWGAFHIQTIRERVGVHQREAGTNLFSLECWVSLSPVWSHVTTRSNVFASVMSTNKMLWNNDLHHGKEVGKDGGQEGRAKKGSSRDGVGWAKISGKANPDIKHQTKLQLSQVYTLPWLRSTASFLLRPALCSLPEVKTKSLKGKPWRPDSSERVMSQSSNQPLMGTPIAVPTSCQTSLQKDWSSLMGIQRSQEPCAVWVTQTPRVLKQMQKSQSTPGQPSPNTRVL